jgi:hypothetical protein
MKYVKCPRCRARFHTGLIYESPDACTRCGAPLPNCRPRLGEQLRALLDRRPGSNSLDWEAITGSQYARRHLAARSAERPSGTVRPAS